MARIVFVTGGARSGKSAYAQRRAESHAGTLLYVATAAADLSAGDAEMAERIARHRAARGERWGVLEEAHALSVRLPPALSGHGAGLLDCVTLWLSNRFFAHNEKVAPVLAEVEIFCRVLPQLPVPFYLVSNELGAGIVPESRMARDFRDLAGTANQLLAAAADEAWLVVAGLPLQLK
jgi:adenosylcobinamide kinase/adenosylcobinamide-phosphate guanylyltransferase